MDLLRSVGEGNGEEILAEVLAIFLKENRQILPTLRESAAAGDRAAVARLAHSLAGSSASVGFHRLNRICLALERLAEKDDAAPMERMSRDAASIFQLSVEALGLGTGGPDAASRRE